jgi:Rieske Fe-S protein
MKRRSFIKSSCNVCLLGASGYLLSSLSACGPAAWPVFKAEVIDDQVLLPLASFPPSGFQLVRPSGSYYNIAVQKKENDQFEALLLKCTHQDNQLVRGGNGYSCNLHGSQFDNEGKATKGPAERQLKRYRTATTPDKLIIYLKS